MSKSFFINALLVGGNIGLFVASMGMLIVVAAQ